MTTMEKLRQRAEAELVYARADPEVSKLFV